MPLASAELNLQKRPFTESKTAYSQLLDLMMQVHWILLLSLCNCFSEKSANLPYDLIWYNYKAPNIFDVHVLHLTALIKGYGGHANK